MLHNRDLCRTFSALLVHIVIQQLICCVLLPSFISLINVFIINGYYLSVCTLPLVLASLKRPPQRLFRFGSEMRNQGKYGEKQRQIRREKSVGKILIWVPSSDIKMQHLGDMTYFSKLLRAWRWGLSKSLKIFFWTCRHTVSKGYSSPSERIPYRKPFDSFGS